jgi:membrane protease YdiL (CAAX protease family)
MMEQRSFFQKYDVTVVIVLLMAIAFTITCLTVGPWEAVRGFAVEALIFAAMFWVARQYLPWEDAERERIKRPKLELALAIIGYLLLLWAALSFFSGGTRTLALAIGLGLPVLVLLSGAYKRESWGLRWPGRREWLVLLSVIVINLLLGLLFGALLPEGELATPAGADLSEGGAAALAGTLVTVFFIAALPEELFFRVFLQNRLASYIPGRWALFLQALLFSAAHLPQQLIRYEYPLPFALAMTMVLTNGVMAGYFWRKTGNLPLLLLLHLLAFSRIGL